MALVFKRTDIFTLEDISFENKKVFLRLDLNVPITDGKIEDDTRIRAALPTIEFLLRRGATVFIASHLGRPKGKFDQALSLMPVAERIGELLSQDVTFFDDCVGDGLRKLQSQTEAGQVVVLENLRFHPGEKNGDREFASKLSVGFDAYVDDAFGVMHREDASVSVLPYLFKEKCVGRLVEQEIQHLGALLGGARKPFALIMGGAKVSDKVRLIDNLIHRIDMLFIGGAMAFTFLKAEKRSVGRSRIDEKMVPFAEKTLERCRKENVQIFLPRDFVVADDVDSTDFEVTPDASIPEGKMGLDIGPRTLVYYKDALSKAHTVFWNGPMGLFEKAPYDKGTKVIAQAVATLSDAYTVIGGGDSAAAIEQTEFAEQISHISTGGGASLEFLTGKWLPGLKALVKSK